MTAADEITQASRRLRAAAEEATRPRKPLLSPEVVAEIHAVARRATETIAAAMREFTRSGSAPEPASEATTAPLSDEQGGDGHGRSAGEGEGA